MQKLPGQVRCSFHVGIVVIALGLLLLQGCATTLETKGDLDRAASQMRLGRVTYYVGSKGGFDYFVRKGGMSMTRHYRLPEAQYSFQHRFPKTNDKTKWVPYEFDLGRNTKGFRGELQEPINTANSIDVLQK